MIPILIDTSSLSQEFALKKADVDGLLNQVVKELTAAAYEQWMLQAGKALHKSKQQYQRGLVVVSEGKFSGAVILNGTVPNMIESGCSAFDMKSGFMKGAKVKQGKHGWYITIPFRMATPGASGFSEAFAGTIPTAVYQVVKQQPVIQSSSGAKRTAGLSFNTIPKDYQASKTRPEVATAERKFEAYKNKTSVYQGLTQTVGSSGGQIMGFRRASANSDPNSWIHTGIKAHNLADKVIQDMQIEKRVNMAVDGFLASRGF